MPWKKGQSGNPKGTKALTHEQAITIERVTNEARGMSLEALRFMRKVMRDKGAPYPSRVTASANILNRAWGLPVTYSAEDDERRRDIETVGDQELRADLERLRRSRGANGGGAPAIGDPRKSH